MSLLSEAADARDFSLIVVFMDLIVAQKLFHYQLLMC